MQKMQGYDETLNIEELTAFIAVVENRGFAGAGRALGRDATVISRRIRQLETRLGICLLARTTRHVALTEAGEFFFKRVKGLLDELNNARLEVSELAAMPRGSLKISLPATFGRRWLVPRLRSFIRRYPDIHLDIRFSDRQVDIMAEGFDMVIGAGKLTDSTLVSRGLARFRYQLFASPDYIRIHGIPDYPDLLLSHSCLGYVNHADWPDWVLSNGSQKSIIRPRGPLQSDNVEALLQAATDGLGIALIPAWLTREEIGRGNLVHILPEWQSIEEGSLHALMPPGKLIPAKTRAFIEFIVDSIESDWCY
ncbi:LysR family transcriptional regulator [Klebsiella sp. BIGb0407]|uniref:LysR family transcriptional regulator n=1 Tax=Klebsiella sp. BIGb0407 TaxID=2940603 RepID=UPI002168C668|nr:LysR family transcriptional regulator [Klebsiella sp. BIGb0407]MCS3430290.1 DNA-binding transcriptional LysR family regulator [Klebsiella sp. BIGb0407]